MLIGSGLVKVLVVRFLLFSLRLKLADHNRQRAALMPMMVGMVVVQMVIMMCSTEAHKVPTHVLNEPFYT